MSSNQSGVNCNVWSYADCNKCDTIPNPWVQKTTTHEPQGAKTMHVYTIEDVLLI